MKDAQINNILFKWSEGNPGALTFMVTLLNDYLGHSVDIFSKLETMPTIRGTNLYVLWNDLCDRDMNKVKKLCNDCPSHILEDACNRQDYSGINLVKEYL